MTTELFCLEAAILNPLSPNRCFYAARGQLVFDDQGKIIYCGQRRPGGSRDRRMKYLPMPGEALIIPGLVDGHSHLSQYHVRGRTGHTLIQWLKQYVFPEEAKFQNGQYARSVAKKYYQKLLSNGVTCAAVYANNTVGVEAAVREAKNSGIRTIVGYTLMDSNVPSYLKQRPEKVLKECRVLSQQIRALKNERVKFALNPRFALATTAEFMAAIGRLAREEGLYIQTHLSENPSEIKIVARLFPGIKSYTEVYERFGLLTPKTLLAHCIHLSFRERNLIRRRGCAVVHCPSSNLFLHSGRFPIEYWRDYPKLCLGSDVGAGPSFSMLDTMRDAYYVNRPSPEYLFYLATLGGAQALGLDENIGNLAPGKAADFSVVTIRESQKENPRELISDLIFKWDQVRFRQVFIGGKEVWTG